MSIMDANQIISQLCDHAKLERDKALGELNQLLDNESSSMAVDVVNGLQENIQRKLSDDNAKWESQHGCLSASKLLIVKSCSVNSTNPVDLTTLFCTYLENFCASHLEHSEVRVRLSAGEVLGALCRKFGPAIFERHREKVCGLIEQNLERNFNEEDSRETSRLVQKLVCSHSENGEDAGANAAAIFHDTAGWKTLETTMKCLQNMIEGCDKAFEPYIDDKLLDLIFRTLDHTNRFVRETGYYLCGSLVSCDLSAITSQMGLSQVGDVFAKRLAAGLADNWSQVRLAASIATRQFLTSINETVREKYFSIFLGPLCLNRYYLAEGVRLYNQETWRKVVGDQGPKLVAEHIEAIVDYYIKQADADNHAVREAACHSIAELALKIDKDAVCPMVAKLLDALLACFGDDSWPVRDAACVACGNFISCFPEPSRVLMEQLYPLFFANLSDSIPSVRIGAAESLAKVARVYEKDCKNIIVPFLENSLKAVQNQPDTDAITPESSERFQNIDTGLTTFGVAKRVYSNDPDVHTDQQMYSCGSLAPKMKKGKREELCHVIPQELHVLLPMIAEATRKRSYVHHYILLESVCKRLTGIAIALGKRLFKPHLELFFEPVFYSLSCGSHLTEAAAAECIEGLAKFLGPNILRGRIELSCPDYLKKFDTIVPQHL